MTTTSTIDPVCGMTVEATTGTARSEFKGETYFFCCTGCKAKFEQAPEQYLSGSGKSDKSGCCCG